MVGARDPGGTPLLLELARPRPTWQGAAHNAVLVLPDGTRQPVVALLGPGNAAADALARARAAAEVALTLRHPGVLRLLQVTSFEGRVAWCYEDFDGLGLGHVVGREGAGDLSARASAELIAQAAEVLLALGAPGLLHPGPEPSDVILGADGHCRIAGFAGPYPVLPAMRAPSPGEVEPAAVYRLGVLLATLISGAPPAAASDAAAHSVAVRRALIGAMERSGPIISERYGQWIRGMLAWAPAERPPLSAVPSGLRAVAWATGGQGLLDWAARRVPELQGRVIARHTSPDPDEIEQAMSVDIDDDPPPLLLEAVQVGPPPTRTRPPGESSLPPAAQPLPPVDPAASLPPAFPNDEPTQEATVSPDTAPGPQPRQPHRSPDTIPVDIGPPVEALSGRRPTLPPGFLDKSDPRPSQPATVELERSPTPQVVGKWTMIAAIVALSAVGLLLLTYLLVGGGQGVVPQRSEGPDLAMAVTPGVVDAAPAPYLFDVPAPDLVDSDTDGFDTDLYLSDTDPIPESASGGGTSAQGGETDEAPVPAVVVPPQPAVEKPGKPAGITILVRLPLGQRGTISAACDDGINGSGKGSVRLWGLKAGAACTVWSRGPDGSRVTDEVTVSGPATIDCFHEWQPTCLD